MVLFYFILLRPIANGPTAIFTTEGVPNSKFLKTHENANGTIEIDF